MSPIAMLVAVFAKVALGAFGGGLATIPFIHHELVAVRPWLTETMFANYQIGRASCRERV